MLVYNSSIYAKELKEFFDFVENLVNSAKLL